MHRLINRLRQRLNGEEGFTLIELLVVIVIIGILLAIAVPSYLGFRGKAQDATASSNVREAVPAAEAYYSDWGNYNFTCTSGETQAACTTTPVTAYAALKSYDSGLAPSTALTIKSVGTGAPYSQYCISEASGNGTNVSYVLGPGGQVASVASAAALPAGC